MADFEEYSGSSVDAFAGEPQHVSIRNSLERASATIESRTSEPAPVTWENIDWDKEKAANEKAAKSDTEKRQMALKRAAGKLEEAQRNSERGKEGAKEKPKTVDPVRHKDDKLRRSLLEKHDKEMKEGPQKLDHKDLTTKEAREHRAALKARFPGESLSAIVKRFEGWESQFRKDPVATREAIMAEYLKVTPQNFDKPKDGDKEKSIQGSLKRADADAQDLADLKEFTDKFGDKAPHLLRQLVEYDKDLLNDPAGASARLAAAYGGANEPAQPKAEHLPPPATREEDNDRINQGLDLAIKHNIMPGLQNDDIQEAVAMVLSAGLIPRTADRFADLQAAYNIVVPPGSAQAPAEAPDAESTRRGSKSISGSPSGQYRSAPAKSGSVMAALQKANGG